MIPVTVARRAAPEAVADIPSPAVLGLPAKFVEWRPVQRRVISQLLNSGYRIDAASIPTGAGKSGLAIGYAAIFGLRTLIVTSTKALQGQYEEDFGEIGLVTLKGMNAYHCNLMQTDQWYSCDRGPCLAGLQCSLRACGCDYFDAVERAKHAQYVVVNYALWMRLAPDALGEFDLIVLDEAHDSVRWCCEHLGVRINLEDVRSLKLPQPPRSTGPAAWSLWARAALEKLDPYRKEICQGVIQRAGDDPLMGPKPGIGMSRVYEIAVMKRKLETLAKHVSNNWVIEQTDPRGIWRIDPLTPVGWAERLLFKGIPRVVMISATVRPKTLALLGLQPGEYGFREYPSDFPVERRPVYYLPVAALGRSSQPFERETVMRRIDEIIGSRAGRRGIIHAVSYDRAQRVTNQSIHWQRLITHDRTNIVNAVALYRERPDAVLVSPSLTTGWDFPDDLCEFQIIMKLPFADTRSAIESARRKHDRLWSLYGTMQTVVQMAGRGMRHKLDRCEVFILDAHWGIWFLPSCRSFAPRYFLDAVREVQTVPEAPESLRG